MRRNASSYSSRVVITFVIRHEADPAISEMMSQYWKTAEGVRSTSKFLYSGAITLSAMV